MNIDEVFERLQELKITTNKESVRRWLRQGKIKGEIRSKKEGWFVRESDLQEFIESRMPDNFKTINDVKENARAEMWWEIVKKNIFEGYIEIKKNRLKECIEHRKHSKDFFDYCWEHVNEHKRGYATPRVPYLLDAFVYDGYRVKFDENFDILEEQILFALIEHLRLRRVGKL
ncbi:helix-turn-helix domain-containing protein (plasmid) [Bacillus carboniphilus]|uniref:Helix-turn-helix domain-containing protein n=1 Tax=Bacillus carboniphilus TaxID=86663 RepID=A0ABY9JYK8_9BACI|nr:helix-turn-helix domain-containing protein [Bacillus carboniphilus]WLR44440.1 helix-turn-helix domain-containing protein [Bacillus carboniphilus]